MKKSILNNGKILSKNAQKHIHGGLGYYHSCDSANIESVCNARKECRWVYDLVGNGGHCELKANDTIPHIDDI